jgi:hypothetical protein
MTIEPPETSRPNYLRDRTRAQIWAERGLTPHLHRLELRGSPGDLSWPGICAYCGEAATERIIVRKAFRPLPRSDGGSAVNGLRAYRIGSAPVPFCASCAARHQSTVQPPSKLRKVVSLVFNPLLIPAVGAAWFAKMVMDGGLVRRPLTDAGVLTDWGLFILFVATSLWSLFLMWRTTLDRRLDPQTEVTRACDFSGDVSNFFEGERRIYKIRNSAFAGAMAELNADRVWTAENQARSKRIGFAVAVVTVVVLAALAVLKFTAG